MRVPLPIVIFLVVTVISGICWHNTHHLDFLTPPSAAKLEAVRLKIESSLPRTDLVDDAISVPPVVIPPPPPPPPPPVEKPTPAIDLGDLTTSPHLKNYSEFSSQGSAYLIRLAILLEQKDQFQRALLAWERVLDLTQPDANQAALALSAIKRLRSTLPDWSGKPEIPISVILHASTSKKLAKPLTPILQAVAHELERATSGIVKVKAIVTLGKTSTLGKNPTPVALWLTGSNQKSKSTEVLSFTADSPETLHPKILGKLFSLIRNDLAHTPPFTTPTALAEGENPQDALTYRVTRLCWSQFAATLNLPPKKSTTP